MTSKEIQEYINRRFPAPYRDSMSYQGTEAFAKWEMAYQMAVANEREAARNALTGWPGVTYPIQTPLQPLNPLPTYPLPVAPNYPNPGYYPPTITCSKPLEEGEWKSDHVPTITTTPSAGCAGRATSALERADQEFGTRNI